MSFAEGGCTCGNVRYALLAKPLFVHCCHCTWCQRESGSAFAVNVLIEASKIKLTSGNVAWVKVPSESGRGQSFARCPDCQIALLSHYSGAGRNIHFVRAGTLDNPALTPPDIHIYTKSKQPFVNLPSDIPCKQGYYDRKTLWPEESLTRRNAAMKPAQR